MTHHTHVMFSLDISLAIMTGASQIFDRSINYTLFGFVLAGVFLGSILPDIDEQESYIGKRTLLVSEMINDFFGHRGATHYFIAPTIIFFAALFSSDHYALFLFGLSFGWLFHILGDALTYGGIYNAFFPFGNKETRFVLLPTRLRFRTNSQTEHRLNVVLNILFFLELIVIVKLGGVL